MGGKQADRKNRKSKVEEEPEEDTSTSDTGMKGKMVAKLQPLLDPNYKAPPAAAPPAEKAEGEEAEEKKEEEETKAEPADAASLFANIKERLALHNPLAMGLPATADDSMAGWLALPGMELDWGPRKSRKGNPSLDRIVKNLHNLLPYYIHILFVIMLLRTFMGRSFFCCLPWLFGLQVAVVMVPDDMIPEDKVPMKFRVAAATVIHAKMWFFFLYEALWATYFMEKILYIGLLALHARSVRPADA